MTITRGGAVSVAAGTSVCRDIKFLFPFEYKSNGGVLSSEGVSVSVSLMTQTNLTVWER